MCVTALAIAQPRQGEGQEAGKDTSGQIGLRQLLFTIRASQKFFGQSRKCQIWSSDELQIFHLEHVGFDHLQEQQSSVRLRASVLSWFVAIVP